MRAVVFLIFLALIYLASGQQCPRCIPLCQNGDGSIKLCGSDGCGGSCGTCPTGQQCCSGTCACTPNCVGRVCGSDGCGFNSCGRCSPTQTCVDGQCVGQAVPDCTGRACGSDGAGGLCGTCPLGQKCRNGICQCAYDCSDRNCGNAVQTVGTSIGLCPVQSCGTCPTGFTCGTSGLCSATQSCDVTFQISDCSTNNLVTGTCTTTWSLSSISGTQTSPPNPWTWQVPSGGYGTYAATINCAGYASQTQAFTLTNATTIVNLCVNRLSIPITVTECGQSLPLPVASTVQITASSLSYSSSVTVPASSSASWTVPGFATFNFAVTANGYLGSTSTVSVSSSTSAITLCVNRPSVPVFVVDCNTNRAIATTATVAISGVSQTYSTSLIVTSGSSASWSVPGFGDYSFSTSASGYVTKSETKSVSAATTSVTVCLSTATVQIDIRNRASNTSIEVGAAVTFTGVSSGSFRWSGLYTWTHGGFGQYSFIATPDSKYGVGNLTISLTSSVSLIIIYVDIAAFCGDKSCNNGETGTTCSVDCISLFLEFENADGSGPVNGPTVNYFLTNPRDQNADTGPNRNSVQALTTRTTGTGSNTVLEETYSYQGLVYFEVIVNTFVNFYWAANTSNVDSELGIYRLRVHLSKILGSTDFNYRVVNTWKPIDATPTPYGPTDLNLHLFHSAGALDINNPTLTSSGFAIGRAISDSKQSGGPATMDISPSSGVLVAIWNSKPPRSAVIAPSQNNRYLVDSGSYVVFYGKTSNAASGKQVGQVVLDELFLTQPSLKGDQRSDLWYVAQFTVNQPAVNQPTITPQWKLKAAQITSARDMIFDCEAYTYCAQFRVPYSDTGRRNIEEGIEESIVF